MKLRARGQTDIGRVRSTNQDSFAIEENLGLYIVADGMGGHAGGEIASRLCCERITEYVGSHGDVFEDVAQESKICMTLADSINHASARIYEYALEEPSLRGMGTTATVMKTVGDKAFCAHVGDSRLYLIRSGYLYQITYDHSLVNEQLRAGIISQEEAETHQLKNVITRSVGYQEEEDVDTTSFDLEKGDLLVLCSDGLHGKVNDQEISKLVQDVGLDSVSELIELANQRGGEDNITAILVEVVEDA